METKRIINIVLSSPGDIKKEHTIVEKVIAELNRGIAIEYNARFENKCWLTDAYPGFHNDGPQALIDPVLDIENCDILMGFFWTRFGKPTKDADSGTEHEIRTAIKSWREKGRPQIMIYFRAVASPSQKSEEAEQYARVLRFKEDFPDEGLYWTYKDLKDFEPLVRQHLTQYLRHELGSEFDKITTPPIHTTDRQIIQRYCQRLKDRFSTINLFGEQDSASPTQEKTMERMADMDQGFIPLQLQEWLDEEMKPTSRPLKIENLFFGDDPPKHLLLRGLPGSGKTTLLRYLTYRFASLGHAGKKNYIPVYLRCKRLNLNDTPLPVFIQQQINDDCENKTSYQALTAPEIFLETPMILLFDGLDEIEDESSSQRIAGELVKLRQACPRCRIIISSRPIGLKKERYPGFYHAELLPLSGEMIDSYLQRWFKNDRPAISGLAATFQHKPRIAALATNPFLLSMICFTFQHGGDTALIERRSDLYANCTRFLLERRYTDDTRARYSDKEFQNILDILKELSLRFFLWQEADFPVDHVNVMGNRILKADDLGQTEQFLDAIQRQTGLIQRAKEGFTFVHRSLWEYFTARALLDKKTEFVIRHAADPFWEEVVRLYAGLLQDDNRVKNLVNGLWNINRPLALRVTTEVKVPATELIKPLIEKESGNQNKLLLIDSVEQSLPLISETERTNLIHETLQILLVECEERDCEVIYYAQQLLERYQMRPLEHDGLIYRLFELEQAEARQRQLLADPANCFQWIEVPGGTFWMGDDEHSPDERPAHRVKVAGFFMSKHPVTNRLLSSFPFGAKYPNYGGEQHPAIGNTWWEAYYFALWIGAQLPTEAEWEYAARGGKHGKRTQYYFGDDAAELPNHAWFGEVGGQYAHAVNEPNPKTGKENLNPLGLANMLGNVWDWCADWFANYPEPQPKDGLTENPAGPAQGIYKILRGGSFREDIDALRCARRIGFPPEYRYGNYGFRVVRRPSQSF